ncbi:unnamed protein product [Ceratitis capitata]|uniref:(Mediterranean fruit fly) hypothetical protein n=1 Tax=Ceratitis capitata TaxID=7213 RepID=A0A811U5W0_CERCA|nr:unnamed protein product [Ceratitis capitata]
MILRISILLLFSQSAAHSLIGTAFDYDYFAPEARRAPSRYQKSSPITTERPFIRYWNNFVRNIRVPVPSITWNMTNPLVNLFNAGVTNVIDTPVGNYNRGGSKRKRSKSTKSKNSKKRKPIHTDYDVDEDETYQAVSYGGYGEPYADDYDPRKIMYFYDASTGQYYKMQTQYVNSYALAEQQLQQQQQQQQNDDDDEAELQEADEIEAIEGHVAMVDAQIEPPTAESVNESNENENETAQHADEEEEALSDGEEGRDSGEVEIIPADMEIFDDSAEEQTTHKQQLVEQTKSNKSKRVKIVEELRNSIGSYMRDDHFNRMRQRAKAKPIPQTLRSSLKARPRRKFTYYLLQPV